MVPCLVGIVNNGVIIGSKNSELGGHTRESSVFLGSRLC